MNKKVKILITGASGYVGARIYKDLKDSGYKVTGLYNNTKLFDELIKVNIKNKREVKKIIEKIKPDVIIHSAANAHTSTCEKDPKNARDLNVGAIRHIAETVRQKDIRLIHISSFNCFNESLTSVYAETKLEAEGIAKTLDNYLILRFSLVTGLSPNTHGHNFYNDLLRAYKEKTDFTADSDFKFETSYLGHIVEVIKTVIEQPKIKNTMIPVIEHGETSRYKIAKDLLGTLKVEETKSGRIIPTIKIDESIYKKYGLKRHAYRDSVNLMKKELELLD